MPSTSSEEIPPAEPGALALPGRRAKGFLSWLDGFLSEELRRAPLEEFGRSRVLAGASLSLVLISGLITIAFILGGLSSYYVIAGVSAFAGYASALWSLRRVSSPRLPALLVSVFMAFTSMLTAFVANDTYLSAHAVMMLITSLTVYLLGPRLGLVTLVPMVLIVGVGHPFWRQRFGSEPPPLTHGYEWVMHVLAAICMFAGWAVGWLYSNAHATTHAALERDIKARKEAEAKLSELHRTLLDVSRQAGMSEVATGVLHNVGNAINSVNTSIGVVTDRLRGSRISKLVQATELLDQHAAELPAFLTTDPRGSMLPAYLGALSAQLVAERESLLTEMKALGESVEHIRSVVSMQQQHARYGGVVEQVTVPQLINDALRLSGGEFERLGIDVRREYAEVPPIEVDRHKLLQILLNLLSNARHALMDSTTPGKRLTIRVRPCAGGAQLRIEVEDNGVGIAPEYLTRMFSQGFTTKKTGHGFGLHISALAAQELHGRLSVVSAGPGQGATFTIELPLHGAQVSELMAPAS
ncbi:sensor histidine kinase [Archangium lansingense]|uniref:histidine kinase n=1 Tax=Archangium lansingense TaxID=2995310 RepID=A0ABT4A179_9BACT|nr:HAMP domain-containing sensor histidine kinase [Archangium lansinium]MCY1075395.1 HAMP domain-containing sensor histidine kinase [Archangium lansinium]